jgi:uncharacterized membrane protein YgdD (TMEM256/DUF423 family)
MSPFLAWGAASGFVAVAAGAFGAHALKARLTPELLAVFETAARYQMYHALALIAVALGQSRAIGLFQLAADRPGPSVLWSWAGWLFVAGTVLFSGSLYVLALTGARWLGAITPFGGLAFLAGWALLAVAAVRNG